MPNRLAGMRVLVATKPIDCRKGADGLVALVPRNRYHVTSFTARSTVSNVSASVPGGTPTVAAPIITSMGRDFRPADEIGAPDSTIIRAIAVPSTLASSVWRRASRRHPNNCCGVNPCRRAAALTDTPTSPHSATICAFSSGVQLRRRPTRVNTSSRRGGFDLSKSSVSDMCPTASKDGQNNRTIAGSLKKSKVGSEHR
jgi:hypothetical protein